jgi:energy-coupling factor transport system permease protein
MMRITIGQYYPAESVIHRLDPRVKLTGVMAYIIVLFFVSNFWGYLAALGFVCVITYLSNVPPRLMIRGLRAVLFILIFAASLNIFLTAGETVVFSFYFIRVTQEGLTQAGKMASRLILLIVGSSILTLTTSPIQLTDAIEYLLKPLKRIKVPAHEIAMMMTIALRMIPTLADETDKIIKAQKARGADFETGGVIKRAKSLIPILVPLFVSAFRRADELATAMDARCYCGDMNRTRMKVMKINANDKIAFLIILLFAVLLLATRLL